MKLKIALFYDWLNQWGGAEKVLLDLIKIYPEAPIYTLIYDPKKTKWLPKKIKIIPSVLDKLSLSKKNSILQTPFYALSLKQFDFSQYDIVISTTQVIGHSLSIPKNTLYVCYFHNINRYIYQTPPGFKLLKPLLNLYQKIDFSYGQKPDYLFCNSNTVKKRIADAYKREAKTIYPGIDTSFFVPSKNNSNEKYFLIVSRLVSHKKIDLAIQACHQLNQKLYIVGAGRDKNKLNNLIKSLKDPNIKLLGQVDNNKLLNLYQECLALICPQLEDFGLTPIEAQSCGKPVIAYDKGGLTETVINDKTGILFNHQTVESLTSALKKFNPNNFSKETCQKNAKKFSNQNFMLNFKKEIDLLWKNHQ